MSSSVDVIERVFADDKKTIPVVFATDSNFLPYVNVAIQSLLDNSSVENNYDIVILNTGINEYHKKHFEHFCCKNFSVRFFDVSKYMNKYKKYWYTHWGYTNATYFRFFIPQLFTDYEKVVYLDGDIALNCDVSELYDIDLGDNYIAACRDLSVLQPSSPAYKYISEILNIPRDDYFNAGIMVFNVKVIKEINFDYVCLNSLKELKNPVFQDQDVFNVVCEKRVRYLDYSYNLMWNIIHWYKDITQFITPERYKLFQIAVKNPKIIHFCGAYKPWRQPWLSYSEYFWTAARKTPFYEEIIYKNNRTEPFDKTIIRNVAYRHRIYFNYLRCKILKSISFGEKKLHYKNKIKFLKSQINDYRKVLDK